MSHIWHLTWPASYLPPVGGFGNPEPLARSAAGSLGVLGVRRAPARPAPIHTGYLPCRLISCPCAGSPARRTRLCGNHIGINPQFPQVRHRLRSPGSLPAVTGVRIPARALGLEDTPGHAARDAVLPPAVPSALDPGAAPLLEAPLGSQPGIRVDAGPLPHSE